MKVGQRYYIIAHAYFHYIGEVASVITPKLVSLTNVVQIHSSQRSWTEFFKHGIGEGDSFDVVADMPSCTVINSFQWDHDIPRKK